MKRRFYALMLVVAMFATTLVGCGGNTTTTTDTTNTTNETEVEESTESVGVEEIVSEQPLEETKPNTFTKTETYNITHEYSEELRQFFIDNGSSIEEAKPEPDVHTWIVSSEIQMVDGATGDVITQNSEKTKEELEENADFVWVSDFIQFSLIGDLEMIGGDTQKLTIDGIEYVFKINDCTIEGVYDDSVDCVITFNFEGIYYEEGNKPNTTSQTIEPVQEPVEVIMPESVEETVPEPEEVEEPKSYSGMINSVYSTEAGNGITVMECKIFEYQNDKTQGTIEATINVSGFDFVLSFDGDASLGTKAASRADGSSGFIYNKDKTQWIQVYNCGSISQETFNQYMNGDLKEYFDWANVDEYYEETKDDTYISAIAATTTMISDVEYKGYVRIILDLEKGVGVHLWYHVPSDVYDEQTVYNTIASAKIISEEESLTSLFGGN